MERFRVKKLIYLISISIAWKIVSYIIEWRDGEMQKIKKVYSLLADEKSKTIFENGVIVNAFCICVLTFCSYCVFN